MVMGVIFFAFERELREMRRHLGEVLRLRVRLEYYSAGSQRSKTSGS
jgi:hypothetical protein